MVLIIRKVPTEGDVMPAGNNGPRVAVVARRTLEQYDGGMRGGDLIAFFLDEADRVTHGGGPKADIAEVILRSAATGDSRATLERVLLGFHF